MKEYQYECREGCFTYVRQGRGIMITGYQGLAGHVVIPDRLPWREEMGEKSYLGQESDIGLDGEMGEMTDSLPVTSVSKKVFLSKKYLRSVVIPVSVESIGDWAFAYCDSLREARFGGKRVAFGKAVFMECPRLQGLYFSGELSDEAREKGIGSLMAAAVTQMQSDYLLDPLEAGSREWLEKWDARMTTILKTPDDEGYSKQILCGEEDYESADLETYLRNSRKKKVRLLLLRLLYPMGLSNGLEKELKEYLLGHTKGCGTDETWQVIRDEYGDQREFYQLFATLGCLTKENVPQVIEETKEENPEMKAYFLKYQADHFTGTDFFGNLLL